MKRPHRNIILASSSKYRQALLARLGVPFDSISPVIDETPLANETPESLVKRLALAKAEAISETNPQSLIIGSDQVAVFENEVIGKPGNHKNACRQLKCFSSKKINFLTGIALICRESNFNKTSLSEVTVQFRNLNNQQIENYLQIDKPYDCAGSFKIERLGIGLFESVHSDDPTSLEGLPLISVRKLLSSAGIKFF